MRSVYMAPGSGGSGVPLRVERTPRPFGFLKAAKVLDYAGSFDEIASEISKLELKSAAIITTKGSMERDYVTQLQKQLDHFKIASETFLVGEEPDLATARAAADFVAKKNLERQVFDMVVGVGGGSVLDVAKAAAAAATNGGLDNCKGFNKLKNRPMCFILAPTTAGTGSEATTVALFVGENKEKLVLYDNKLLPDLAVIDPRLARTMPYSLRRNTAMDALCHAIDSYLSRNASVEGEKMALAAIRILGGSIEAAHLGDVSSMDDTAYGAHIAGEALINCGIVTRIMPTAMWPELG